MNNWDQRVINEIRDRWHGDYDDVTSVDYLDDKQVDMKTKGTFWRERLELGMRLSDLRSAIFAAIFGSNR